MKNKIYLAVLEVTMSGKKSYQVFLVNRKSKKAIEAQIRKRYDVKPNTKLKVVNLVFSGKDSKDKMNLILSHFNFVWGSELFNKNGEDSYRIRYLDHLLTLVYFLGLEHMHKAMQEISQKEISYLRKTVAELRDLIATQKIKTTSP